MEEVQYTLLIVSLLLFPSILSLPESSFPLFQDIKLWEDLCELEGRLGLRYLTHESEDAFWQRQGARPHPLTLLTKKALPNPLPTGNYYVNIHTIHEQIAAASMASEPDFTSLDKQVPNGSVATSRVANGSPCSERAQVAEQTHSPRTKRKSYVCMPDEEVEKLQQHAQRVGYTVSTV